MSSALSSVSPRFIDARSWAYSNATFLTVLGVILAVFATFGLLVANAPGLYMDAINPDYELVKILHPDAPITVWEIPGDLLFGRFPIMCGLYAGSYVTYWMLPFAALLGDSILTVRIARVCFGIVLLCAVAVLCRQLTRSNAISLLVTFALAIDPTFVYGLRTQAYIVLFPSLFALIALFIAHRCRELRSYFVAGILVGLATFGYFVYAFMAPGIAIFVLREGAPVQRLKALGALGLGVCVGLLPYALGYGLLFGTLGISGGLDWLHSAVGALHVSSDDSYAVNVISTVRTIPLVLTGQWLELTIWQNAPFDFGQAVKLWMLLGLPFAAFLALYSSSPETRRAFALPLLPIASFVLCATYFGSRLGGHDLIAIVSLSYVAAAVAAAALLSLSVRFRRSIGIGLAVCACFVVVANIASSARVAQKLGSDGGGSLYSTAISQIPKDAEESGERGTPYVFMTWGEMMPFIYETAGTIPAFAADQLANAVCRYGRADAVLLGDDANFPNARGAFPPVGLRAVSDRLLHDAKSGYPYRIVSLMSQKRAASCVPPVASVASAGNAASDSRSKNDAKPMLTLTSSATVKGVIFEAQPNPVPFGEAGALPIVSLRWSVPGSHKIEIHAAAPGGQLFAAGGDTGYATTGPWVQAGDQFFLQDVSAGSPGKTVAKIAVTPYGPEAKTRH